MDIQSIRKEIRAVLEKSTDKENLNHALTLAQSWTQSEPTNPLGYLHLGDVQKRLGQKDQALKCYHYAAELYARAGKMVQSIAAQKLVLELDPKNKQVEKDLSHLTKHKGISMNLPNRKNNASFPPTPLFSSLKPEALHGLVVLMKRKQFSEGEFICKQGDPGNCIYVLSQGRVAIRAHQNGDSYRDLAVLQEGAFFGEFAYFTDSKRHASVLALENVEVLELHRDILQKLIHKFPETGAVLKNFYHQRVIDTLLAKSILFQTFSPEDRKGLMKSFQPCEYKAKTPVLLEGDPGDTLYFIESGQVEVFREKKMEKISIAKLSAGDFFGELAFLHKHRRIASVRTLSDCKFLTLKRDQVKNILEKYPVVEKNLKKIAKERLDQIRKISPLPPGLI